MIFIDFLYRVGDSDHKFPLSSAPGYKEKENEDINVKQYQVQFVRGVGYKGDVILPVKPDPDTGMSAEIIALAEVYQYSGNLSDDLVDVNKSVVDAEFKDANDKTKLWIDNTDNNNPDTPIRLAVLYTFPLEADIVTTVNYRIEYQMERSSGDSLSNLTYSADSSAAFYKLNDNGGEFVGQTPEGVTPNIALEDMDSALGDNIGGWKRTTNKAELELQADTAHPGDYKVIVRYERNEYRLTFDTLGGTYVKEQTRLFGQPLYDSYGQFLYYDDKGNPIAFPEVKRTGYKDNPSWELYDKADYDKENKTAQNYETMPAKNVVAKAVWIGAEVSYRVVYWKQNANDDDYTYADDDTKTAYTDDDTPTDGYAATFTDHEFFHLRTENTATLAGKTYSLVNGVQEKQEVKGDGSTVVNVYGKKNNKTDYYVFTGGETNYTGWNNSTTNYDLAPDFSAVSERAETLNTDYHNSHVNKGHKTLTAGHMTQSMTQSGHEYEYEYYYLDLTARYEENIADLWPEYSGVMGELGSGSGKYYFVSWITSSESYYRFKYYTNNNNLQGASTIKGKYATMSKDIIGVKKNNSYGKPSPTPRS